jgi:hypothetical protein
MQDVQHHVGVLQAVSRAQLDDSLGRKSAVTIGFQSNARSKTYSAKALRKFHPYEAFNDDKAP